MSFMTKLLTKWAESANNSWTTRHTRKVAYEQLSRMTDRELRDIGITRADIYKTVYGD